MARIEMRTSRAAGLGLLLFLLGVITGRLILEPSGQGFLVFLVTLPVLLAILVALFGVGPGVLLAALFAGTALTIRSVVLYAATGWIVLLLVPVAAVTVYVLVNTVRAMWQDGVIDEGASKDRQEASRGAEGGSKDRQGASRGAEGGSKDRQEASRGAEGGSREGKEEE